MTNTISRRTLAKGSAWAVPAVALATAAPAATASLCTAAEKTTIDNAFSAALAKTPAITEPAWEINFYQTAAALDGFATTTYVNVKNISGVEQVVNYSNRLTFDINSYQNNTATNAAHVDRNGRAMTQVTTSFGDFSVDGGAYLTANQIAYPKQPDVRDAAWTATAGALTNSYKWGYFGGKVPAGDEIDIAFGWADGLEWAGGTSFRYNNYLTVTPTNNPALALAPSSEALAVSANCMDYYNTKLADFGAATANSPASKYVVRGPLSGTTQISVGQTVDSRVTGNYTAGTGAASTNGIW